ncbi:MAG: hypothetical protein MK188_03205 [Gammaproteobacteria bacterium]|nr:hypothetical protein [Gammaproteobacteria bacterium]
MSNLIYSNGNDISVPDQKLGPMNSQLNQSNRINRKSLSTILRTIGACAVLASLSLFLLEGWTEGNDLYRYIKLLSLTGLITSAGVFLSFIFKEVKGARVFFGLSLVATVANFMILGALAYSLVQLDGALVDYPAMLKWQTINIKTFIPLAIGASALLGLLSYFSFNIFARLAAKKLTVSFIALNCLFLIPVRETLYAATLASIALVIASCVSLRVIKKQKLVLTTESRAALACLFLPGILILARALGLYAVDGLMLATIFGLIYYATRVFATKPDVNPKTKILDSLRFVAGLGFSLSLLTLLPSQFDDYIVLAFSSLMMAFAYDMGAPWSNTKSAKTLAKHQQFLISTSVMILILTNIASAWATSSIIVSFMSLLAMLMLTTLTDHISSTRAELRAAKIMSILAMTATGLLTLARLVDQFNVGSWILFAGGGVTLILIASIVERSGWLSRPSTTSAAR